MPSSLSYQQPRLVCALAAHTHSVAVVSDLALRWRAVFSGPSASIQRTRFNHVFNATFVSLSGAGSLYRCSGAICPGGRRSGSIPSPRRLHAVGIAPLMSLQKGTFPSSRRAPFSSFFLPFLSRPDGTPRRVDLVLCLDTFFLSLLY